jgi:hypothetical protein
MMTTNAAPIDRTSPARHGLVGRARMASTTSATRNSVIVAVVRASVWLTPLSARASP